MVKLLIIVAECVFCNVTPFFYLCFILSDFFVDGFLDILGKFILSFLQLFMVGRCVINFTGMCVKKFLDAPIKMGKLNFGKHCFIIQTNHG